MVNEIDDTLHNSKPNMPPAFCEQYTQLIVLDGLVDRIYKFMVSHAKQTLKASD